MGTKWTKEQEQAINEKGENILVAAAAGSGKTAVLVERIINKIINENIDIDKLLVVTFTNAAAAEMRERILDAIYKKLEEQPENGHLQNQITLLNKANICTIDSFCLDVIKSNFYEIDISPNFRIADTAEMDLLKQEVLEELFEEKYEKEEEEFIKLLYTYTSYKDDSPLKELVLKIHNYIQSNPFPEKWLREKIEMFNLQGKLEEDFGNTTWGKVLLQELKEEIIDCIKILEQLQKEIAEEPSLEKNAQIIRHDIEQMQIIKDENSWDKIYSLANNIEFITWAKGKDNTELREYAKKIRDGVKEKFRKKIDEMMIFTSKEANEDILAMHETLKKLEKLIIEFGELLSKKKKEKNILDFSDIEHLALNILVKVSDEKIEQTEVAKRLQAKYQEIAIDEYQDSNLVQEYILTSVSNSKNIFMVGDVKQSIYKFRQARPELFLEKYKKYVTKDMQENGENLKIQLFKNFRSRENVLKFTNLIFQNIMSKDLGDIQYIDEEYLNLGAQFEENSKNDLKAEIDIIDLFEKENKEENQNEETENDEIVDEENDEHIIENTEIEAKFVAKKIQKLIESKFQVYDLKKQKFRNIEYKDIVILLRSPKIPAPIFEQELIKLKLPVFSDSSSEYLNSIEIQTIMCLLKVIDNPIQDIPLVTVLRSSIGGFTDNDLIEIRLADRQGNYYNAILKARINVRKELKAKIDAFLDRLDMWRTEKEYLALDELIWKIYTDTGFFNYVGLLPNGLLRQANLKILFERAKQYESASFKGLFNFIRFIERLQLGSGDLSPAKIIGENDNVIRIMSIHKSKGLEFPVVFLANTGRQFNLMDLNNNILLHQDMGIGVKYIDYDRQIQNDTLSKRALKNCLFKETLSEEMRILYVALTRAKEKIFITGMSNNVEKENEKMLEEVQRYQMENEKINPILVKKYKKYMDWCKLVYLYNKTEMEKIATVNIIPKKDILGVQKKQEEDEVDVMQVVSSKKVSNDEIKNIAEIVGYEYEYMASTNIPTKTSVTAIKKQKSEKIASYAEATDPSTEAHFAETEDDIELGIKSHSAETETANDIELGIKSHSVEAETENDIELKVEPAFDEKEAVNAPSMETQFPEPQFYKKSDEEKITGAKKGTLIHLCMQKLDLKRNYMLQDVKDLVKDLQEKNIITQKEAEAINVSKVLEFTKSDIWQEVQKAKLVCREKPFYVELPAKLIYDENVDEKVLVQGIIDLFYINANDELVLVDFKTDFVNNNDENYFIDKYHVQLDIYKYALEQALGRQVSYVYIYSTCLGKKISRKFAKPLDKKAKKM